MLIYCRQDNNYEYIEAIVLVKHREFERVCVHMHTCTYRESFRILQRNRNLAVLCSSLKLGAFFLLYISVQSENMIVTSVYFFLSLFFWVWRCQIHFQLPNSGWWSLVTISFNIAFSIFISFLAESVTYSHFWHLTSFLFFLKTNRRKEISLFYLLNWYNFHPLGPLFHFLTSDSGNARYINVFPSLMGTYTIHISWEMPVSSLSCRNVTLPTVSLLAVNLLVIGFTE